MSRIYSFPPIATRSAKILILGSMPGKASLQAGEYYANPRNHFWRLMGEIIPLDRKAAYAVRVRALQTANIALWDVLHSCHREGSLDAAIEKDTQAANDFTQFFSGHGAITHVFFNGSAAEQIYRREVMPKLNLPHLKYQRLPSTSPANASCSFARKLEAWQAIQPWL